MNRDQAPVHAKHEDDQATLSLYISGFILSLIFTLSAFALVEEHIHSGHTVFTHPFLIGATVILALAQFFAQLYFFLHLGRETKPRWKLLVLCFMVLVVFIVVFGSIWIMYNLNYRMTPQQMNTYMLNQNGGI
jgi:cytochrome o ubiquinol oxidase subunit IV